MDKLREIGDRMYLELQDVVNDAVAESGDANALPRIQALLREWDAAVPRQSFVEQMQGRSAEELARELTA